MLPFFKKQRPCLVGMEACATSHHWAREIEALGHQVRLMPPRYVKPYVKRNKNDMADAEAICEAVSQTNRQNRKTVATDHPNPQARHTDKTASVFAQPGPEGDIGAGAAWCR